MLRALWSQVQAGVDPPFLPPPRAHTHTHTLSTVYRWPSPPLKPSTFQEPRIPKLWSGTSNKDALAHGPSVL